MTTVIIIAIIMAILYFIAKYAIGGESNNNESQSSTANQSAPIQEQAPKEVSFPPTEQGYSYHEMVGMYHRGITPSDFGVYEGRAVAETNNPHDKFAVGIYRSRDNKLVGYIPKEERGEGNEYLHKKYRITEGRQRLCLK